MGSNTIDLMAYGVDLVLCIDMAACMVSALDMLQNNTLNFYQDFISRISVNCWRISELRVRLVLFRDYLLAKEQAMRISTFFSLPAQIDDFHACVRSLKTEGGIGAPENGLEALAYAMKSDWSHNTLKKRHVIVVLSDAETYEIGSCRSAANYPKNMAKDFEELSQWWGTKSAPGVMDERAKRLILFTPDVPYWDTIRDNWNNVIHYEMEVWGGLQECDYDMFLSAICNTI